MKNVQIQIQDLNLMQFESHGFKSMRTKFNKSDLPDKRTKSFRSRPLLAKEVWRLDKLLVGGGIFAKASEALDIFPSLLPVGTFQYGPPYHPKYKKIRRRICDKFVTCMCNIHSKPTD